MLVGITALLSSLPALIAILSQLGLVLQKLVKVAQDNNVTKWINQLEGSIDGLEKAKTADEKLAAGKALLDSIRNLGPPPR